MSYSSKALDPLVKQIIEENTRTIIDLTVREIADEVKKRTGYLPSTSVVRYCLSRLGLEAQEGKARKWTWLKKP